MVYRLNLSSFLPVTSADEINGFSTVVFNIPGDRVLKINQEGYELLKYLEENGPTDIETLSEQAIKFGYNLVFFHDFMKTMVEENVIICEK